MSAAETSPVPVPEERLQQVHAYWRAANYLAAAQLYLKDNVLLKRPLEASHIKPRLLGHWGTVPGLNLVYTHLNRLIRDTDASVLLVVGPGHGAPAINANLYLEGSLAEYDPQMRLDGAGMHKLVGSFSWPYGLPSHLYPGTPGQIHEGGELGYSLSHAFGAALDNPDLIVACIVGDGEAETGALATAWHANKFLSAAGDGAVLPILHLNGYKISSPTLLARMSDEQLTHLFTGYGYQVRFVTGDDPMPVHLQMWQALDWAYAEIRRLQYQARQGESDNVPAWPVLLLRTPKGWTGPREVDGKRVENTFHSHQIPLANPLKHPGHLPLVEAWLRSYGPEELFDAGGRPLASVTDLCPHGERRMGMNPNANGGALLKPLLLPDFARYAVDVPAPGQSLAQGTKVLGEYVRDVFRENARTKNFRLVCPDETTSNRMQAVFEATCRAWQGPVEETDEYLSRHGRVMEILSEHTCQGWLEGYLLTGRHGLYACYEAFIPIVDSMLNQYAKWLKVSKETPWREPLASLNYVLTSHLWRQDHNGYTHQAPGFINTLVTKKKTVARVYLPPDTNCLLSVMDHCFRSRDQVNLVVANKAKQPQWLGMQAARQHCARGASEWDWAGSAQGGEPDVVLAAAGDVATTETVRAAELLRESLPALRVRVVNVVDLFALMSPEGHPHGLTEEAFGALFTESKPVIFAFHGYPNLVHELLHHRPHPERFHVHGYREEGYTTTPFDMLVLNQTSRYHLAMAALARTGAQSPEGAALLERCRQQLAKHQAYIREHGEDMPEVLRDMPT